MTKSYPNGRISDVFVFKTPVFNTFFLLVMMF